MTVKELKAKAAELNITVPAKVTKAQIEELIAAAETPEEHVVCYTCQKQIPVSAAEKIAGQWFCAEMEKCENANAQAAAKATANAKAKKAPKTPKAKKPPVVIRYRALDYTPQEGEKQPPRQVQVILNTIRRECDPETGLILKSVLVEILNSNNNNVVSNSIEQPIDESATFTHDLRAKQPCLHVLMHYQKRLIEEGRLELVK